MSGWQNKVFIFNLLVGVAICHHGSRFYNYTEEVSTNSTELKTTETNTEDTTKDKVKIKLYYETLCPASVNFFLTHLKPTVERLSSYLDVHLIPYGHAKTRSISDGYRFSCQHGPDECFGNKLQACSLDAVENKTEAILFNACLMDYAMYRSTGKIDYVHILNWCGHKQNVLTHGIWECVNSNRGSLLLKQYGEETHVLRPRYVPYILIDDDITYQKQARWNLLLVVCHLLRPVPQACYTDTD